MFYKMDFIPLELILPVLMQKTLGKIFGDVKENKTIKKYVRVLWLIYLVGIIAMALSLNWFETIIWVRLLIMVLLVIPIFKRNC